MMPCYNKVLRHGFSLQSADSYYSDANVLPAAGTDFSLRSVDFSGFGVEKHGQYLLLIRPL